MHTENATTVKNQFGAILNIALREPVVIKKSGRKSVVMIAYEDYEALIELADKALNKASKKAKKKSSVGKNRQTLKEFLNG